MDDGVHEQGEATRSHGEGGLWSTLREAVAGTQADLTAIPVQRAVVLLAVPTILEMSMESLLTIVDMYFVSRLGADAVATVGLTESMMAIVFAMAMGLSAGATALVARRTGEKDAEGASAAAGQVLLASLAISTVLAVVGSLAAPQLLGLMGASPAVVASGAGYTRVMLGGNLSIFLLFVINTIFRSVGQAAVAMRTLWLANLLNMVLAPVFIFGLGPLPAMGVTGAAVATTIGRSAGVAYQLLLLRRGSKQLTVGARHLALRPAVLAELLRISGTATLQVLVETASWLGLVRIMASFGSAALAAYTITMRIAMFTMMPAWGMAGAAATLVGQNLGAGSPERARRTVNTVALYNVLFLGGLGLALALAPGPVVGFFTDDPALAADAAMGLRIVALGFLSFGYGMVTVQAFNGAGDTATPLALNAACFWLLKIPLAYTLAGPLGLGPRGVFIAVTVAYTVQSIGAGLLFRRGRWATRILAPAGG